jgi:seryl-tRNA synthetase
MLDITLLRKDLASAVAGLEKRKKNQPYLDVSAFSALEAERKTLQTRTEEIQARRNTLNKQIGPLKAKGESTDALMAEVNALKAEQESQSRRLEEIQPELHALLLAVPNLPHASVPLGEDEAGNVEMRRWAPKAAPVPTPGRWPLPPRTTSTSARRWASTSRWAPSFRARASPS